MSQKGKIGWGIFAAILLVAAWGDLQVRVSLGMAAGVGAFLWWAIRTRVHETVGKYAVPGAEPFTPTHAAANLAIDTATKRLWLRDERGRRRVLDARDVRGWTHHWTDRGRNLYGRVFQTHNYFQIRTSDVNCPTWIVRFPDHTTAREWHDRLTTFLND